MSVSAATAANVMLDAAEERGLALDPLKLQKLLYLTNGYYLAQADEPWISDSFEAWRYGPVIPSIYRYFRQFGSGPIKRGTRVHSIFSSMGSVDKALLKKALDFVLDRYGSKSGIYLSELTHKVDSPWYRTRATGSWNEDIPTDEIKRYFSSLVPSAAQNAR